MTTFVSYSSDNETIITTPQKEHRTIDLFFTKGGRSLDDYDRVKHVEEIEIRTRLLVN